MKRMLVLIALLFALGTSIGRAQTRVAVSLSLGDPYFAGQVVIGRPFYHSYTHPYVYRYHPFYYGPRVIVVRPHRYYGRRYYRRGW